MKVSGTGIRSVPSRTLRERRHFDFQRTIDLMYTLGVQFVFGFLEISRHWKKRFLEVLQSETQAKLFTMVIIVI